MIFILLKYLLCRIKHNIRDICSLSHNMSSGHYGWHSYSDVNVQSYSAPSISSPKAKLFLILLYSFP